MNVRPDFAEPQRLNALAQMEQAESWAELAANACEPNPFYHPALLMPGLDMLGREQKALVMEAREDGLLIGLLPVEQAARHGRMPFSNVKNLTHAYSFFGAPLLRRGYEEAAWSSLLVQLDNAAWTGALLHLVGQDANGPVMAALEHVCARDRRGYTQIHRYERAKLESFLSAEDYWQTHVRAKKRKEIRRLINRLEESGKVEHRRLSAATDLEGWCADFLALEASGWKGESGTALGNDVRSRRFFLDSCANAFAANMLDMLRIDIDGRAIAMLVNFRHGLGAYSFKIAIDEAWGRYSPGVLIEIDNLSAVQSDSSLDWMDSCAQPGHPMINSLWGERRVIAQYRIALKGTGSRRLYRNFAFMMTALLEKSRNRIKGTLRP